VLVRYGSLSAGVDMMNGAKRGIENIGRKIKRWERRYYRYGGERYQRRIQEGYRTIEKLRQQVERADK
jgi:hypothetical protein